MFLYFGQPISLLFPFNGARLSIVTGSCRRRILMSCTHCLQGPFGPSPIMSSVKVAAINSRDRPMGEEHSWANVSSSAQFPTDQRSCDCTFCSTLRCTTRSCIILDLTFYCPTALKPIMAREYRESTGDKLTRSEILGRKSCICSTNSK